MISSRIIAVTLALSLTGFAAAAEPSGKVDHDIEHELQVRGFGEIDSAQLTSAQKAHIRHLLYRGRGPGDTKWQIKAVLRRAGTSIFDK